MSWLMYVCGGVRNEMSCWGGDSLRRLFGEVVEIAKYIIESKQANKHKRKSSNISNRKWNQRRSTHILLLSITTTMMQNISIHVASSGRASFPPIKEYGIMHFIPTILGSKFGHSLPPIKSFLIILGLCPCLSCFFLSKNRLAWYYTRTFTWYTSI